MTPARDHIREVLLAIVVIVWAWMVFRRLTMRVF